MLFYGSYPTFSCTNLVLLYTLVHGYRHQNRLAAGALSQSPTWVDIAPPPKKKQSILTKRALRNQKGKRDGEKFDLHFQTPSAAYVIPTWLILQILNWIFSRNRYSHVNFLFFKDLLSLIFSIIHHLAILPNIVTVASPEFCFNGHGRG